MAEYQGILIPGPATIEENSDETFREDWERYTQFRLRHNHKEPMNLHIYADFARKVTLPRQKFINNWVASNPKYTQQEWEKAFNFAGEILLRNL